MSTRNYSDTRRDFYKPKFVTREVYSIYFYFELIINIITDMVINV